MEVQYAPAIKKREIALRLHFLFSWKHEHGFLKGVFLIFASSFCIFLNFLSFHFFSPIYSPCTVLHLRPTEWTTTLPLVLEAHVSGALPTPCAYRPNPAYLVEDTPPSSIFDTTIDSPPPRLLHDVRELVLVLALAVL